MAGRSKSSGQGGSRTPPRTGWKAAFAGAFAGALTPDTRFLGGETIGELTDGSCPRSGETRGRHAWDTTLAVLHGGVNRAILSYALTGQPVFFGGFEQAPACINVLDVDDAGGWIVRIVNSAEHLAVTEHLRSTTMEEYYAEYAALRAGRENAQTRAPNAFGCSSIGTWAWSRQHDELRARHPSSEQPAVRHGDDTVELSVDDERRHVDPLHLNAVLPVAIGCFDLRQPALRRRRGIEPRGEPLLVLVRCSSRQPGVNDVGNVRRIASSSGSPTADIQISSVSGGSGSWSGPPGPVPTRTSDRTSSGRRSASVSAM